jgi:RHS repeat-associated protein
MVRGYCETGDVLNDGQNQYLYDGEGRICAVASTPVPGMTVMTGYLYDADGTRVAKGRISAWSCDPGVNGFQTTSDYILGPGGEQVTEMGMDANSSMAWQHTNVYAGGALIATYDQDQSSGTQALHFQLADWLGTRRVQTDYAGNTETSFSSLPFGDQLSSLPTALPTADDATEHHFTGKERDTESGNDYFGARYYSSAMGRFMSPDWSAKVSPVPYAILDDPQTLNLYTYMRNNALRGVDPDGHCDWCNKIWNAAKAVKDSIYIKVEVGVGIKAQVKAGNVKIEVGAKNVRETDAKSNNKGTVKYVREASLKIEVGRVSIGPSISEEQTVQKGNSPTNMDAPTEVHGNFLYDLGEHTRGSNSEVGYGLGGFVGIGGSVEWGVDAKELIQGVRDAFTDQQSAQTPPASQPQRQPQN